jgi:hypothetical protein
VVSVLEDFTNRRAANRSRSDYIDQVRCLDWALQILLHVIHAFGAALICGLTANIPWFLPAA